MSVFLPPSNANRRRNRLRSASYALLCGATLWTAGRRPLHAEPPTPYPAVLVPGTKEELANLLKESGSKALEGVRRAEPGQFVVYGFSVIAGARCRLELMSDKTDGAVPPKVSVTDLAGKPVPTRLETSMSGATIVYWTVPAKWDAGARIPVILSAKDGLYAIKEVRFTQIDADANNDGLPDFVATLLRSGLPPNTPLQLERAPDRPYTIAQTPRPVSPQIDLQTDAMFVYGTESSVIASWKNRGYTVWTMGGSREGLEYAAKFPQEQQTDRDGKPLTIEGSHYLAPTQNRIELERERYRAALTNGSEGVCPEEPEYWAKAGYEGAFKDSWQQFYRAPWQPPHSSVEARWKAGRLMAEMQAAHIGGILDDAAQRKPNARRLVALHSPLNYPWWNIIAPHHRIVSLPSVQEVVGQVWTGTARTQARYAGLREDRTFSVAYLEYSSLHHLLRGTGKRLWFLLDPLEDDLTRPLEDYRSHYEQTLAAALLFPEVNAYEVMPWPERVYERIPEAYATVVNSVNAALQEMHRQNGANGNAVERDDIGVFYSDSMQWQRAEPNPSDFDGVQGLTLPLLQRGVPVQMVSLDRAADPNYLRSFKTLLLSYDFQKPMNPRLHTALASWVRNGGSLLYFGGADAYNAVADSWWRQANLAAPQDDLWKQLGLPIRGAAQTRISADESRLKYTVLLKGEGGERTLANRRAYVLDLTKFAAKTGSVAVRFSDVTPEDGWGALAFNVELRVKGQLVASFRPGSEIENRFLAFDKASQFNGAARYADGTRSWTYQFDNLPKDQPIALTVDMGNGFLAEAAEAEADYGHTLLAGQDSGALGKAFPRMSVGAAYPVTSYPLPEKSAGANGAKKDEMTPDLLFHLRAGGTPIWAQEVGKGLVVHIGVAPGFFSGSERSAALLRGLTQYAHQRAGGVYQEPGFLRLKRGKYTIVRTFGQSETIEGATLDLLSPTLAVTNNRTVPPRSIAVVREVEQGRIPRLSFVSGRVQASVETPVTTAFFARGALNTNGVARLTRGAQKLAGARATDRLGRPVSIQAEAQGDTVFVRYPNHPDGVIVRVGWQ